MKSRISDKGRVKQKRGEGAGKDYLPWLQVTDFSSSGLSTRIKGKKTGRVHHLLSQMETKVFQVLDFSSSVTDIREQYPLHPIHETLEIAKSLSLRHPEFNDNPVVMTTDFFVSLRDKSIALTIKGSKELTTRVLEKFEIERQYWERRNISWYIVTEKEISSTLSSNVLTLRDFPKRPSTEISNDQFLKNFRKHHLKLRSTAEEVLKYLSRTLEIPYPVVRALFLYLINERRIVFDYANVAVMDLTTDQYEIHN